MACSASTSTDSPSNAGNSLVSELMRSPRIQSRREIRSSSTFEGLENPPQRRRRHSEQQAFLFDIIDSVLELIEDDVSMEALSESQEYPRFQRQPSE